MTLGQSHNWIGTRRLANALFQQTCCHHPRQQHHPKRPDLSVKSVIVAKRSKKLSAVCTRTPGLRNERFSFSKHKTTLAWFWPISSHLEVGSAWMWCCRYAVIWTCLALKLSLMNNFRWISIPDLYCKTKTCRFTVKKSRATTAPPRSIMCQNARFSGELLVSKATLGLIQRRSQGGQTSLHSRLTWRSSGEASSSIQAVRPCSKT